MFARGKRTKSAMEGKNKLKSFEATLMELEEVLERLVSVLLKEDGERKTPPPPPAAQFPLGAC